MFKTRLRNATPGPIPTTGIYPSSHVSVQRPPTGKVLLRTLVCAPWRRWPRSRPEAVELPLQSTHNAHGGNQQLQQEALVAAGALENHHLAQRLQRLNLRGSTHNVLVVSYVSNIMCLERN